MVDADGVAITYENTLANVKYDKKKMMIVMACEERAGEEAYQYSKRIEEK